MNSRKKKISSQGTRASEKTRLHLLDAALDLFSEKGFYGVSVKEICDKAGCNISLVSYHYGGKEGLYKSCIEPAAIIERDLSFEQMQIPNSLEDFVEALGLIAKTMLSRISEDPRLFKIISREMEADDPKISDLFEKTFHLTFMRLLDVINHCVEQKWLRADLKPLVATMMFIGTCLHAIRVESFRKRFFKKTIQDPDYRNMIADEVVNIFMNGIKA